MKGCVKAFACSARRPRHGHPYRTESVNLGRCLLANIDNVTEVLAVSENEVIKCSWSTRTFSSRHTSLRFHITPERRLALREPASAVSLQQPANRCRHRCGDRRIARRADAELRRLSRLQRQHPHSGVHPRHVRLLPSLAVTSGHNPVAGFLY